MQMEFESYLKSGQFIKALVMLREQTASLDLNKPLPPAGHSAVHFAAAAGISCHIFHFFLLDLLYARRNRTSCRANF